MSINHGYNEWHLEDSSVNVRSGERGIMSMWYHPISKILITTLLFSAYITVPIHISINHFLQFVSKDKLKVNVR